MVRMMAVMVDDASEQPQKPIIFVYRKKLYNTTLSTFYTRVYYTQLMNINMTSVTLIAQQHNATECSLMLISEKHA